MGGGPGRRCCAATAAAAAAVAAVAAAASAAGGSTELNSELGLTSYQTANTKTHQRTITLSKEHFYYSEISTENCHLLSKLAVLLKTEL